jgi:tRNA1Val (adenine37-N6)-methyltransferase
MNPSLNPPPASHFRGWAKPGPIPPGLEAGIVVAEEESLDAISGHFRLLQLRKGHRFSTDDILAAWYGTSWCPTASRVLDLGSGVGTVGMIAAWRLPGAQFVTVEAQSESVGLARRSAAYNGLTPRYDIRLGDFRDAGVLSPTERFDLVLGSPPYFPLGSGVLGDHPQKVACRFEVRGDVRDYCLVAARHLAAGGFFALVFPSSPECLRRVVDAVAAADLVLVRRRSIIFREGDAPLIGLFGMMRRQDLPDSWVPDPWVEPDLVIRDAQGQIHPEYSAVKLAIGFPP